MKLNDVEESVFPPSVEVYKPSNVQPFFVGSVAGFFAFEPLSTVCESTLVPPSVENETVNVEASGVSSFFGSSCFALHF